jgi:hypothetical protein
MADAQGQQLNVGDVVEIVQMDDPAYRWLVGERASVAHIPDDDNREKQVIITLDRPQAGVTGLSTHQVWVAKIVAQNSASSDGAVVEG